MKQKIKAEVYFKVYEKYIKSLGEDGTSVIDIKIADDIKDWLDTEAKKYNVSIDAIIGGYLEIQVNYMKNESKKD